jgi:hypothetical protein
MEAGAQMHGALPGLDLPPEDVVILSVACGISGGGGWKQSATSYPLLAIFRTTYFPEPARRMLLDSVPDDIWNQARTK